MAEPAVYHLAKPDMFQLKKMDLYFSDCKEFSPHNSAIILLPSLQQCPADISSVALEIKSHGVDTKEIPEDRAASPICLHTTETHQKAKNVHSVKQNGFPPPHLSSVIGGILCLNTE